MGAAGKTGAIVVERAVAAGHVVTVFVRDAARYRAPENVRVIAGDATDHASVDEAMAGQDAVIDTIGGKAPYCKTTLERSVAGAVVAAMKANGARRVIVISSFGVGDSADQVGWFVEHVIVPTWLRGSTEDKAATEAVVRASGIAFVIVRPAMLTDDAATGNVKVFRGRDTAHKTSRADVAQFCVDQLTSDEHVGSAVTIANS
ncbi:NAD(P)-dependent oxidoreductase [Xanthobacter autotrophicus]|uniref:NAD(P)-dependent oxidoreductase n=1 Tax=Xanthobacter autotrophicus TaxID=280 RepID=UPI0024A6CA2D|nr:NAD(P)H-binding protein [Xanthobacter autotrophicus]MDI4654840.1 SDR family oxidoreductase [Xanthobacter autotrophicus]